MISSLLEPGDNFSASGDSCVGLLASLPDESEMAFFDSCTGLSFMFSNSNDSGDFCASGVSCVGFLASLSDGKDSSPETGGLPVLFIGKPDSCSGLSFIFSISLREACSAAGASWMGNLASLSDSTPVISFGLESTTTDSFFSIPCSGTPFESASMSLLSIHGGENPGEGEGDFGS